MPEISYPRKCFSCEHIANNAANWHYHKRTHDIIPAATNCHYGCGNSAKIISSAGIYSCGPFYRCPAYRNKLSEQVRNQWQANDWEERRHHARTNMVRMSANDLRSHVERSRQTKYRPCRLLGVGPVCLNRISMIWFDAYGVAVWIQGTNVHPVSVLWKSVHTPKIRFPFWC